MVIRGSADYERIRIEEMKTLFRMVQFLFSKKIYVVETEDSVKLFRFRLWTRNRAFEKKKDAGHWLEIPK